MSGIKKRGFASLSPERRREIASLGGKKAHSDGKAHKFTSEEAKKAGKKGGDIISQDIEHMREIGRKGGKSAHAQGKAHEFTSEKAKEAGSKGGKTTSQNREHMAEIGKKGGKSKPKRLIDQQPNEEI